MKKITITTPRNQVSEKTSSMNQKVEEKEVKL